MALALAVRVPKGECTVIPLKRAQENHACFVTPAKAGACYEGQARCLGAAVRVWFGAKHGRAQTTGLAVAPSVCPPHGRALYQGATVKRALFARAAVLGCPGAKHGRAQTTGLAVAPSVCPPHGRAQTTG